MRRLQNQMARGVNQGFLAAGIATPEQKDEMRSLVVEIANHGFGKGFPAVTAVRTGPVGFNGEDVVEQQHALALPVREIAGGIGVVTIFGVNLTVDVDERGRDWLRIWDREG